MNTNGSQNLFQRLNAMSAEVARIKPTGRTAPSQGAQPAMSIADVEDALRDLFVKHGVVSGYSFTNQPVIVDTRKTQSGNDQFTWQADLNVWLVNADTPEERIDCRAVDIGSSPSAAVSFALKRFYRGLFHLAEEGDEGSPGQRVSQPRGRQVNERGPQEEARASVTGARSVPGSRATGQVGTAASTDPASAAGSAGAGPAGPAVPSSSDSSEGRLRRAVEGFYGKPWDDLQPTVRALFRGKHGVDYAASTDEQKDEVRHEIEGLALSQAQKQSTGVPA